MFPPFKRCWPCEILGLQCSRGGVCQNCLDAEAEDTSDNSWMSLGLDCRRDPLTSEFDHAFRGITHVDPGNFHLKHDTGEEYIVKLAFEETPPEAVDKYTMQDLNPTVDFLHHPLQFRDALFVFLDQFEMVDELWKNWYEPGTFNMIRQCARYQTEILAQEPTKSVDDFQETTLLAALLRCLIMSHQLAEVDGIYSRLMQVDDGEEHVLQYEGLQEYWGLQPSVTVQQKKQSTSTQQNQRGRSNHTSRSKRDLSSTLKHAIATTQRLLFRRRPADWPCLIYALCLLALITSNLQPSAADFMVCVRDAGDEIEDVVRTLCQLYPFCSDDTHPLHASYDSEAYAKTVCKDTDAAWHFDALNRLWLEFKKIDCTRPDDYYEGDLYRRIDHFANQVNW